MRQYVCVVQQVLSAVQWPLDSPVLAQLYLALLTYILMDQVSRRQGLRVS